MRNWVFIRPLFWKVLFLGLVVDWGSKGLINLLVDPISLPIRSMSELQGKVFPYPPDRVFIAHAEHWHEHWYDFIDGLELQLYRLVDWIAPFDLSMAWFALAGSLAIPLGFSLFSIGNRKSNVALTVAIACLLVVFIGNKGEVWLTGHVTDWIGYRISGNTAGFTNLSDLFAYVGIILIVYSYWSRRKKPTKESGY